MGRDRRGVCVAVLAAIAVGGCASPHRPEVAGTAVAFARAVSAGSTAEACRMLAPATREELEKSTDQPCEQGLAGAGLKASGSVHGIQVWGSQAQVRIGRDVSFLAEFPAGWLVTAAGCRPRRANEPYDCLVQGR